MKAILRVICGVLVMPFLYVRYSFVLFLPFLLTEELSIVATRWGIYIAIFMVIMSLFRLMEYWAMLIQWVFSIEYDVYGQWRGDLMHSHSIYSHPLLEVRGIEHKLSISVMGSNLYDEDAKIIRSAIFYWFFGYKKRVPVEPVDPFRSLPSFDLRSVKSAHSWVWEGITTIDECTEKADKRECSMFRNKEPSLEELNECSPLFWDRERWVQFKTELNQDQELKELFK